MNAKDVAELAREPAGYWTGAAHEAVIAYINAEHRKLGVTQRHWMTLNALARSADGLTRAEVGDDCASTSPRRSGRSTRTRPCSTTWPIGDTSRSMARKGCGSRRVGWPSGRRSQHELPPSADTSTRASTTPTTQRRSRCCDGWWPTPPADLWRGHRGVPVAHEAVSRSGPRGGRPGCGRHPRRDPEAARHHPQLPAGRAPAVPARAVRARAAAVHRDLQ